MSDTLKNKIISTLEGYKDDTLNIDVAYELIEQALTNGELYTKREVDFIYLAGCFNTGGIDGLHNEIKRLKSIGKEPHQIIDSVKRN